MLPTILAPEVAENITNHPREWVWDKRNIGCKQYDIYHAQLNSITLLFPFTVMVNAKLPYQNRIYYMYVEG